jgi:CelD/BcsL family acetyltransferase involved in cellulose biosynthesis
MPQTVEWVRDEEGFAALAAEWDAVLPDGAHPYDDYAWISSWWQAFGAGSQLAICTIRRHGALAAVMPLREEGGRLLSLTNSHTFSCRPLARDEEAMTALLKAVTQDGGREIRLTGLEVSDGGTAALESTARETSMLAATEAAFASPYIDTSGGYDAWREQNKHRWKAPLERKWRKTERDHESEFQMVVVPPDLEAELDEGLRIEASGWKGDAGTAIESADDSALFYRLLARAFQERGELRFSWIKVDGKAISFDYCILYRRCLYTLKSGFDEDYKNLAPGLVLRLATIKECFESDIDLHDLLGDEVGWKTRFADGNRPHVNMRIYSLRPTGFARYLYRDRMRPRLKAFYRRLRPANVQAQRK